MLFVEEFIKEVTFGRGSPCLVVPTVQFVSCVLRQFYVSLWPLDTTRDVHSLNSYVAPCPMTGQSGVYTKSHQNMLRALKYCYHSCLIWSVFERCLVAFAETMISFKQLPLALIVFAARPQRGSKGFVYGSDVTLSSIAMPSATVNILGTGSGIVDDSLSIGTSIPKVCGGICLRVTTPILSCFRNTSRSINIDVIDKGGSSPMRAVDVAFDAAMGTACPLEGMNCRNGSTSGAAKSYAYFILVGPVAGIVVARVVCHLFSEYMLAYQIIQKGLLTAPPKWERRRRRRTEFAEFGRRAYDEFGADIHKKLEIVRNEKTSDNVPTDEEPTDVGLEANSRMHDIVDKALDKFNLIMDTCKNTLSKKYSADAFFSHRTDHCIRLASSMLFHPISQLALLHVFLVSGSFMINTGGVNIRCCNSYPSSIDFPRLLDKFLHNTTSAFNFLLSPTLLGTSPTPHTTTTYTSSFSATIYRIMQTSFSAVCDTLSDTNTVIEIIKSTLGSFYCFISSVGKPVVLLTTSSCLRSYVIPKVTVYFTNCCFAMFSFIESRVLHRYDFARCGGETYLTESHRNPNANNCHRGTSITSYKGTGISRASSLSHSDIARVVNGRHESVPGCPSGVTSCIFPLQPKPKSKKLSVFEQVSWRRTFFEQMRFTIERKKASIVAQKEICEEMVDVIVDIIEPVDVAVVDENSHNNVVGTHLPITGDSPLRLSPIQRPTDRIPFVDSIGRLKNMCQKSSGPISKKGHTKAYTKQRPLNRTEMELASVATVDAALKMDMESLMSHTDGVLVTADKVTTIVTLHFEEHTIVNEDAVMLKKTIDELNTCLVNIERSDYELTQRLHFYDSIIASQQRITMRRAILFRTVSDVVGGIVAHFPLYTLTMLLEVRALSYVLGMQSHDSKVSICHSSPNAHSASHDSASAVVSSSASNFSETKDAIVSMYRALIDYVVQPVGDFLYNEYICLNGALRYVGNLPVVNSGGYAPVHASDTSQLAYLDSTPQPYLSVVGLLWHGLRAKILSPIIPLFTGCLYEYKRLIVTRVLLTEWRLDRHEEQIYETEQQEIDTLSEANKSDDVYPIARS